MYYYSELKKVLESCGCEMYASRGGSCHCTFWKAGCQPITIPRHEPVKRVCVEMVKQIVENEVDNNTCGETVESAVANVMDAKKAWLEAALEEGITIYEPDSYVLVSAGPEKEEWSNVSYVS